MKKLKEEIATSYAERRWALEELRKEARDCCYVARVELEGFRTELQRESMEFHKDLVEDKIKRRAEAEQMRRFVRELQANFRQYRKEAIEQLTAGLQEDYRKRKAETESILKEAKNLILQYRREREDEAVKLHSELIASDAERRGDVAHMRHEFRRAQSGVRSDILTAAAAWRRIPKTGIRKTEERRRVETIQEEEPVDEDGADALEEKLLAVINEHPEGITLSEVADSFGVVPIVFGKASKRLIEAGKVRKEDKYYYPVHEQGKDT
jgi:hypothetical protein